METARAGRGQGSTGWQRERIEAAVCAFYLVSQSAF